MSAVVTGIQMALSAPRLAKAITVTAAVATRNMANDTREKTVGFIMGNRKSASNPFPQNIVNQMTGRYYSNSVARKWPSPPKSYRRPGEPISLAQVKYEKSDRHTEKVGLYTIPMRKYIVGPIGGGRVMGGGSVPLILEKGGTTTAFYRQVRKDGAIVRTEFRRHKPKAVASGSAGESSATKRPKRYSSWSEVNAARARNGTLSRPSGAASKDADAAFIQQGWMGPKTFTVRPRPYISRAWDKVRKRSKWYLGKAQSKFPGAYKTGSYLVVAA